MPVTGAPRRNDPTAPRVRRAAPVSFFAFFVVAVVVFVGSVAGACSTPAAERCNDDGDCVADERCLAGVCAPLRDDETVGEGEGDVGEGEGEGDVGEGEGDVGEGEGDVGEGEGDSGEGEGEGEGEGDVGEGEGDVGEGEGESPGCAPGQVDVGRGAVDCVTAFAFTPFGFVVDDVRGLVGEGGTLVGLPLLDTDELTGAAGLVPLPGFEFGYLADAERVLLLVRSLEVPEPLTVTGQRPLSLVVFGDASVSGRLRVDAGADPPDCAAVAGSAADFAEQASADGGGGGGGGGAQAAGGDGAFCGGRGDGVGGDGGAATTTTTGGGCRGGDGGGAPNPFEALPGGAGGAGGGALVLQVAGTLSVGAGLDVAGARGGDGQASVDVDSGSGGGGGGGGGRLLVRAGAIVGALTATALGGRGGDGGTPGASTGVGGVAGEDGQPSTTGGGGGGGGGDGVVQVCTSDGDGDVEATPPGKVTRCP